MRYLKPVLLSAALSMTALPLMAQEVTTLRVGSWLPAHHLIVSGIIGLAIILSAWAITSFVISRLLTATQDTP